VTRTPAVGHRAALGRAVGLGGALLPAFVPLDVVMKLMLFPDADLAVVFGLRALACTAAFTAWWIAREPRFSDRFARVVHAACLAIVAATITGMATQLGGPSSVYIHGLSVIIMVRSASVPAPVAESVAHGALVVVVYPLGFALLYVLDPGARAAWLEREALALFAVQYLLVCASIGAGCLASRASWIAQTQLYQARKLGRYRLEAQVGKGGQGEVWLARDTTLHRKVALKLVRASTASRDGLQLFEREALLASRLESPHTVRVYDFGASDDGVYYLAMEYLDGADLCELSKGHGPMPPGRVIHFGIDACRSLEEAHAKGLVHRDVKPSNLFATRVGDTYDHVKLLDFGVARSLVDDHAEVTRTGHVRGTFAYMAPEVCRGEPATPASDLYSLGATLYHLLAGSPPFSGSSAELVAKQLSEPPPPLQRHDLELDPELLAVISRCLEKAPAQRFPDARSVREALERCRERAPWRAEDAMRFWNEDRRHALARWQADTVT
jgi:eukaryotic-like serine/threonine-protein kinase